MHSLLLELREEINAKAANTRAVFESTNASRIQGVLVVISHAGLYNGPLEEPEIIFADMLRARMVLGSEVTVAGDKSSN